MKLENIKDIYVLAPMQKGLLFESLSTPNSGAYIEHSIYDIRGQINVPVFKRAWQKVMDRHPILRTAFVWEDIDEPVQVVFKKNQINFVYKDLQGTPEVEQKIYLQSFIKELNRDFDLSRQPLFRLALVQLSANTYQFSFVIHHLLIDGWSYSLILNEFLKYYEAFYNGQELILEDPRPYRDYIGWLGQQDLTAAESFWRQALKNFSTPTHLGIDLGAKNLNNVVMKSEDQKIQLSEKFTGELESFARQNKLTLNTVVQGTLAIILSRYSDTEDVLFGNTVSGRPAQMEKVESMIGIFINTLPVRVKVTSQESILSYLKNLQALQAEMNQYEYSSLAQIQGWSEVSGGSRLFETLFVFENYPNLNSNRSNRMFEINHSRHIGETNYPLSILALPGPKLMLAVFYDLNRFETEAIKRMLGHFETLLQGIVANPQEKLSSLPLLTDKEKHQLLVEWNQTDAPYPKDRCVHELFEEQVTKTPDAIAVVCNDDNLTYEQLNKRANQLAHYLKSLGIGQETLVGICVERSLDMIVGILGIMKAGGAYVPLDPNYPKDRLAFMLDDSGVNVLLTQKMLVKNIPIHRNTDPFSKPGYNIVKLDADWKDISKEDQSNLVNAVRPYNLAYVIYTSGSTGKPKGVQIIHSALMNSIYSEQKRIKFSNKDIVLSVISLSFDPLAMEIFLSLTAGAQFVIADSQKITDSTLLLKCLEDSHITVMHGAPAIWRMLLESGWQDKRPIKMLSGGEILSSELSKQLLDRGDSLWNCYGPTESAIVTTFYKVKKSSEVNIGRPIENTQVFILDSHLQPVPVGLPGELYIGGAGLARGYLNQPELTAEKFISNPFKKGERLYKTGDMVRYLPDGNIEYFGRIDQQVKIRGFRIEIGEVESVISQHPGVKEVVVMVSREGESDHKGLAAYLVRDLGIELNVTDLYTSLKEKLPLYMIPSDFIMLKNMPLTPNGKIDRKALPAPQGDRPLVDDFYAPRDAVETLVAQIWEEILKIYPVGVKDNFFRLGGHSLLATQLISKINSIFERNIPLSTMIQNPTVEHLSGLLRRGDSEANETSLVTIQHKGVKSQFYCVHPVGGTVFSYLDLAHHLGMDRPFHGIQSKGIQGGGDPYNRIEDMAAYYIDFIHSHQYEYPPLLGGWSFGGIVAYEMARQLKSKGHELPLLVLFDCYLPSPGRKVDEVNKSTILSHWFYDLAASSGKKLNISLKEIRHLDLEESLQFMIHKAKEVNLISPDFSLNEMGPLIRVFESNVLAMSHYIPQPYEGRTVLFQAAEQPGKEESQKKWAKLIKGSLEFIEVPGNHYTFLRKPHIEEWVDKLKILLNNATSKESDMNSEPRLKI